MHRLSMHVFGEGERVPILHDARGLPLFYPTLFTTSQLRNAGAAVNTIRNKLADILVLLRWEKARRRDLEAEFGQGAFLSVADIASLRDFTMCDMRQAALPLADEKADRPVVLHLLEARVASRPSSKVIGKQQHYNRLSTIADYLEFVASVVTQHRNSAEDPARIARMVQTLRKHRPRGLASRFDEDAHDQSPPSELIERFMRIGAEDHPQNPFLSPPVRLRNAIIFGLFRSTGIRRGELLSLRIDQFDLGHEPQVWIRRNQDDVSDSRRYQPVTKTRERLLPLPQSLADQVQRYIMDVRSKVVPARRHPYLLVSHQKGSTWGQPISLSALNGQIFARMRAADPAFEQIHPHAFRHHFNYELSRSIDQRNAQARGSVDALPVAPISEAREMDVRAFLNGHRDKASGATYNRRHIRETSDRAARQLQSGLIGNGKRNGDDNESDQ